jgi:hypothetical protein
MRVETARVAKAPMVATPETAIHRVPVIVPLAVVAAAREGKVELLPRVVAPQAMEALVSLQALLVHP